MEDAFTYKLNIGDNNNLHIFGIFDGCGGKEVSHFVATHFIETFEQLEVFKEKDYEEALKECFLKMDELLQTEEVRTQLLKEAKEEQKKEKYFESEKIALELKDNNREQLKLFTEIFDPRNNDECNIAMISGCSGCVVFFGENDIYIANAGNSRAIICQDDKIIKCSKTFNPTDKDEKKRIDIADGYVDEDGKINGIFDISRGIGNLEFKRNEWLRQQDQLISAEPEVIKYPTKDSDYIVMGSNGVWVTFKGFAEKKELDNESVSILEEIGDYIKNNKDKEKNSIHKKKKEEIEKMRMVEKIIGINRVSTKLEEILLQRIPDTIDKNKFGYDNMTLILIQIKPLARIKKAVPKIIKKKNKRSVHQKKKDGKEESNKEKVIQIEKSKKEGKEIIEGTKKENIKEDAKEENVKMEDINKKENKKEEENKERELQNREEQREESNIIENNIIKEVKQENLIRDKNDEEKIDELKVKQSENKQNEENPPQESNNICKEEEIKNLRVK